MRLSFSIAEIFGLPAVWRDRCEKRGEILTFYRINMEKLPEIFMKF